VTPQEQEEAELARAIERAVIERLASVPRSLNRFIRERALNLALQSVIAEVLREHRPFLRPTILVSIDGGSKLSLRAHLRVLEARVSSEDARVLEFPRRKKS
jgi:hypothetical protein